MRITKDTQKYADEPSASRQIICTMTRMSISEVVAIQRGMIEKSNAIPGKATEFYAKA